MKLPKFVLTLILAAGMTVSFALAQDAKKDAPAAESKKANCCVKAAQGGGTCTHACCVEAAKASKNCERCGGTNVAKK